VKNIFAKLNNQPKTQPNQVEELTKDREKIKLNIGCGTDYKEGWINIDNNSDNNITRLDLNWDLRNSLPFESNSVDYIFNEHFIEHLTVEESQKSIKDFMRVLKPGGVMRIAMPDLEYSIALYLDKNWRKSGLVSNHGLEFVETPAELLNMSFRWWGHQWIYDWVELRRRLKQAGYEKVIKADHSKSRHVDLRGLETREMSMLIAEVTK
jgi:predicted SAM-dependent methyltransferase